MQKRIFGLVAISGMLAIGAIAKAAEITSHPTAKTTSDASDESWSYQPPSSAVNARAIVQEKAEVRSAQRMERLAAQSWYGVYAGRPSTSARPSRSPAPAGGTVHINCRTPGTKPFSDRSMSYATTTS